ncbi:MAG: hypothetical protein OXQ31_10790 [Spirochaetaceae bacterium]|nr:hypothetical protein [Spirochaetaceae bacterium]
MLLILDPFVRLQRADENARQGVAILSELRDLHPASSSAARRGNTSPVTST